MNRPHLLLCVGLMVGSGHTFSDDVPVTGGSWWKTPDQRGAELLQSGDAAGASQVFRDSRWRGVSQFRNGNFAEAQKEFSTGTDPGSLYNAGTAAARAGDYEAAIEQFERVLEADPTHEDASHNLDISRQLRKKQQQSSDQKGDSEGGDDSEQSEDSQSRQGDQQQGDQQQDGQQQDGQQQDGEQGQQSEQQSEGSQQDADENNGQDGKGELSTDKEDAKAAQQAANQQAAAEQSEENPSAGDQSRTRTGQEQNDGAQQAHADAEPADAGDATRAADADRREPISESEQATEQWMRRIPDDPSQLLRNKIKLNHMIQHENVTDLPEPW